MKISNIPLTLLKVAKKEGTAKATGKPYAFHVASVVDEDAEVFALNVSDELAKEARFLEIFSKEEKNLPGIATIKFSPKGFDIGASLLAFKEAKRA